MKRQKREQLTSAPKTLPQAGRLRKDQHWQIDSDSWLACSRMRLILDASRSHSVRRAAVICVNCVTKFQTLGQMRSTCLTSSGELHSRPCFPFAAPHDVVQLARDLKTQGT